MVNPEENLLAFLRSRICPNDSVLDIGCGDKRYQDIGSKSIVSVDAWPKTEPDLLIDLEISDLPYVEGEFDVVMMLDFIEHLPKDRGLELIEQAKRICKRELILFTPLLWTTNQENYVQDGNPFAIHKSLWGHIDFKKWNSYTLPCLGVYYCGVWEKGAHGHA
ncbi:hypothetical protein LCGC14_0717590 [marine sediment metagenome]|uniref:Methyltransferase type 11 domain-containing protein n=1 Tax=marine sediment metagenome TaxID=412755 RepID=A0A0F9QHL4_9ZZZZ